MVSVIYLIICINNMEILSIIYRPSSVVGLQIDYWGRCSMRTVVVHSYDMILGRSRWKKQRRPQSTLMVVIALLVICLVLGMLSLYVRAETQSVSPAALCLALDPQIFSGEGEHRPV